MNALKGVLILKPGIDDLIISFIGIHYTVYLLVSPIAMDKKRTKIIVRFVLVMK